MIVVDKIAKNFGDVTAIRDVSFSAKDAQITTLLGANGSGKSTTLRTIAALLKPNSGRCEVDGVCVQDSPLLAQARLGVFPDQFGLYLRLTAREHIEFYAELHGLSGQRLKSAVDEVVSVLQMDEILDRRTDGFSQGQRMKVALAQAIVHKPQNIVLDEPTRGLDVMSIRLLRGILKDLKKAGHCVLLSSHVMAEVEILSDHVVMIADGVVCADGNPSDLVAKAGEESLEEAFVSLTGMATGKVAA